MKPRLPRPHYGSLKLSANSLHRLREDWAAVERAEAMEAGELVRRIVRRAVGPGMARQMAVRFTATRWPAMPANETGGSRAEGCGRAA